MTAGEWTPELIAEFQAELHKAMQRKFKIRMLAPLPLRTRLKIARGHLANQLGFWLVDRKMTWAARKLWRI